MHPWSRRGHAPQPRGGGAWPWRPGRDRARSLRCGGEQGKCFAERFPQQLGTERDSATAVETRTHEKQEHLIHEAGCRDVHARCTAEQPQAAESPAVRLQVRSTSRGQPWPGAPPGRPPPQSTHSTADSPAVTLKAARGRHLPNDPFAHQQGWPTYRETGAWGRRAGRTSTTTSVGSRTSGVPE